MIRHDSMRGWFAAALHDEMAKNNRVWCLTGDLGFGMLDAIRDDFPTRFCNCGASEQAMVGAAVGLALQGCKPFVYSITPFLLYRPFEWLRNYVHHDRTAVRLVGSGLDDDYLRDGFTHHAHDAKDVLALLPNIVAHFPSTKEQVPGIVGKMVSSDVPAFLCLRRY